MEKRIEDYGKALLAQLDEQTDGRMYTRYDIEIAQMGFRDGYKAATEKACGALDVVYFPSKESREKAKQIVRKAMEKE